jgi:alpha-L-rhamnosidase
MQKFAILVHQPADAQAYAALSLKISKAFNAKYLDKKTFRYDNNTVTANLLPLYFGITPVAYRKAVFKNIVDKILNDAHGHISTGVIGTQWLMRGLTDYGRPDIAYRIAGNDDYPSWGYMVKHGATTIWELWNGDTANPAMNSRNHIMLLGDLIAWFYQDLAGIKTVNPGFKEIVMKPAVINGLHSVNADYQTPYGMVKSTWISNKNDFNWHITIPPNSKALVYVPATSASNIAESGNKVSTVKSIKLIKMEAGRAIFEVGSGNYDFEAKK